MIYGPGTIVGIQDCLVIYIYLYVKKLCMCVVYVIYLIHT